MLNDEICKLRERLNDSIINDEDLYITYHISVDLDELIAKYYSIEIKSPKRNARIMSLAKG